jgi:hypothetical protein
MRGKAMKHLMMLGSITMAILLLSGISAQAAMVYSDVHEENPPILIQAGPGATTQFTLALQDYAPGTDLNDANLVLNLADESGRGVGPTAVLSTVETEFSTNVSVVPFPYRDSTMPPVYRDYTVSLDSILDYLEDDGTLTFLLRAEPRVPEDNDFLFARAWIEADAVPIPPALLLMGSGLIALIGLQRRSRS